MKQRSDLDNGTAANVISDRVVLRALDRVEACESCGQSVSRPFRAILAEAAGADPTVSGYVPGVIANCPGCGSSMDVGTRVRANGEHGIGTADVPIEPAARNWQDHEDETMETVLVTEDQLEEAQAFISGCIRCAPRADLPFVYILDELTESDPATTSYVLGRAAHCPRCDGLVSEETLVVPCGLT